jgi:hypothetical protein
MLDRVSLNTIEFPDLENMGLDVEIAFPSSLEGLVTSTSGLAAAILVFPLPLMSDSVSLYTAAFLDQENMGLAVEIAFLSSLEA